MSVFAHDVVKLASEVFFIRLTSVGRSERERGLVFKVKIHVLLKFKVFLILKYLDILDTSL